MRSHGGLAICGCTADQTCAKFYLQEVLSLGNCRVVISAKWHFKKWGDEGGTGRFMGLKFLCVTGIKIGVILVSKNKLAAVNKWLSDIPREEGRYAYVSKKQPS